jgi:hypothetical protein
MIIPRGTEIEIDAHGQLSVRTPGNLVIQNSGHYGEIESVNGSIRIEANAEVEAVSLRCAETCYVQGSLTSWKVKAKAIHLEDGAQARIVLQETEAIEIGRGANLVGNFGSEKELFLLFSRFAQQLRSLPFYFDRKAPFEDAASLADATEAPPAVAVGPAPVPAHVVDVDPLPSPVLEAGRELPDQLFFALVLLERESKNESYGTSSVRVLGELVKLLKNRDVDTLRHTRKTLFSRIVDPADDVGRAEELIERFFTEIDREAAEAVS